jgi:hypothetical protein
MLLAAAALAAVALAGCGGEGITGGGKVIGNTVTVYSLTPDPSGTGRDYVDGEKLALSDAGGRAGAYAVNFASLDLGEDEEDQAEATRRAISDSQIVAAVADATRVTVPLLNAAGILQVTVRGDGAIVDDPNASPAGERSADFLFLSSIESLGESLGETTPFERRFRDAYGRAPGDGAEQGYAAMRAVLGAIARAGTAGSDRARVIASYFKR